MNGADKDDAVKEVEVLKKINKSEIKAAMDAHVAAKLGNIIAPGNRGDNGDDDVEVITTGIIKRKREFPVSDDGDESGEALRGAMNISGITPTYLANVLREGLSCRKSITVAGKVKKVPDFPTRIKYLELAHKLRGDLKQSESSGDTDTYEERIKLIMRRNKQ